MSGSVEINPTQLTLLTQPNETKMQYIKTNLKQKRTNAKYSPEAREKKRLREYRKRKRASNSFQASAISREAKQKKRLYAKEHRKQKRLEFEPVQSLISKFYDDVSQGPIYILYLL